MDKAEKMPLKVVGYTKHPDNSGDMLWHMDFQGGREDVEAAENAIIEDIRKHGYVFSGNYHQYGQNGAPVFSDGTLCMCSMRHWGDIMYRAIGAGEDEDPEEGFGYCMYAWEVPGKEKRPSNHRYLSPATVVQMFQKSHPERYQKVVLKMREEDYGQIPEATVRHRELQGG